MPSRPLQALFVHGMGRTTASGWLMLRALRAAGLQTTAFGYSVRRQSFAQITGRLAARIAELAENDDLVLIGHSLGGVLLRHALGTAGDCNGRIRHLFLLGSPVRPSTMAVRLASQPVFRWMTTDCGHLLGCADRMASIATPSVPTTGVAGTRGITLPQGPFGTEPNDGVVTVAEVSAAWLEDQLLVPVVHTLLPSSRLVTAAILSTLERTGSLRAHAGAR